MNVATIEIPSNVHTYWFAIIGILFYFFQCTSKAYRHLERLIDSINISSCV